MLTRNDSTEKNNMNEQTPSDNYFPLKKSKTSLLTICAITTLFFLCTGCSDGHTPPPKKNPVTTTSLPPIKSSSKEQLPLINDDADDDIGMADTNTTTSNPEEMSVIQFLNMQKQTQTKRIEVLKNELDETKARLDHIKNDLMIKGSTKEKMFNERMQNLEQRVKDSDAHIAALESALDERSKALEDKRQELENLSMTFSKTNNHLGETLERTKAALMQEIEQAKATLAAEREQFEKERAEAAEVERQLNETNSIINQLQSDLNTTHSRLEQESTKTRELQAALEKTQQQYQLAMEDQPVIAARLQTSQQQIDQLQSELQNAQARLWEETTRAKDLEATAEKVQQQYQLLLGDYHIAQAHLKESTQKTLELTNSQQMFTKSKDILESGLLSIIKDLEGQLAENMQKTSELTNNQHQIATNKSALEGELLTTIDTLKNRLANEQQRAQDYQQQLAFALENNRIEQQRANDLKEMVARQSQNNKELAMNLNEKPSGRSQQDTSDLQKRLADAEAYARELEASLEQISEDGVNALQIHQLDREVEVHKESLLAAQRELLELSEDYTHLDMKYGDAQHEMAMQIHKLEEQNIALEKSLASAQQRLAEIKQTPPPPVNTANDEQYKRMNATLDHVTASLEREKAKRQALENELAELHKKQEASSKAMPNIALAGTIEEELQANLQDALTKYEAAQQENKRLQQQLESTALWASNLQNEVSAYETTTGNTGAHYQKVNGSSDNSPAKLKAKIAYLTTRLAQEKNRAQEAADKLQEAQTRLRDIQNYGQ